MDVPLDSAIAVNTRTKIERDAAEREQLKRLVLSYESGEDARQTESLAQSLGRRGIRFVNKSGS